LPEFHQVLKVSSLSENVITLPSSHHLRTFHHFAKIQSSKSLKIKDQKDQPTKVKRSRDQRSKDQQEIKDQEIKDQGKVSSSKVN